jgi:hypothetical protein
VCDFWNDRGRRQTPKEGEIETESATFARFFSYHARVLLLTLCLYRMHDLFFYDVLFYAHESDAAKEGTDSTYIIDLSTPEEAEQQVCFCDG